MPRSQRRGDHVDAPGRAFFADHRPAEQPARGAVGHQFHRRLRALEIARPGVGLDARARPARSPRARACAAGKPGSGEAHSEDRSRWKFRRFPGSARGRPRRWRRPPGRSYWRWCRAESTWAARSPGGSTSAQSPAANTPRRLVSMRSSVRMAPLRPDLDARFGGQFHIGLEAGRQHHQVAGNVAHAVRLDRARFHAAAQLHAVPLQLPADRRRSTLHRRAAARAASAPAPSPAGRCGAARRRLPARYSRRPPPPRGAAAFRG